MFGRHPLQWHSIKGRVLFQRHDTQADKQLNGKDGLDKCSKYYSENTTSHPRGGGWWYHDCVSHPFICTTYRRLPNTQVSTSVTILLLSHPLQRPSWPTLEIPSITLDYHLPPYNASKVAILIENRSLPCLAPLMLHMIGVVPPEWRFRFMGSIESVAFLNSSKAIQHQVESGKLDLTFIPSNMSTEGQEMISRFWTTLWLYETVLAPAEWLLVFQTDSIPLATPFTYK